MRSPVSILYDAEGNPVAVVQDDTVYRLAVVGKIQDSEGTTINPAKEETLFEMRADLLQGIHKELGRIRTLLEMITDEHVGEHEVET